MTFRMLLALMMSLIIALFGVQNRETLVLHFLTYEISAPAAIAIIVAYVTGALSGALLSWKEQRRVRKYQQQVVRSTIDSTATAASVPATTASIPPPPPVSVSAVSAMPEKQPASAPEKKKRSWW